MKWTNRDNDRRAFIKGVIGGVLGISAMAAHGRDSEGRTRPTDNLSMSHADEILYYETEDFRKFYKSLRD